MRQKMEELGVTNMSNYMRKMLLDGYCVKVDTSSIREMAYLIRMCSNNLNQYAKAANTTGSIYLVDIEKLEEQHKRLLDLMGEILDRLSDIR